MAAEVLFHEMMSQLAAGDRLDAVITEIGYKTTSLTDEEAAAPGGYFGYLVPTPGVNTGAFVRIGFAKPCTPEERLDAARTFLHLQLLQRSYA